MPGKSSPSVTGPRYRFELLSEAHILNNFDCEHTFLAIYLRDKALEEARQDLSRTYVLLDMDEPSEQSVVGYFTLRADSISYTPTNGRLVSLPLVEIAYLARHIKRKGRDVWGIGPALLVEALRRVDAVSHQIGVKAVHLSYTEEGKALYADYGFGDHPYGDGWLLLSIADVREALAAENEIERDDSKLKPV
jgi:hypothetical protein